MGNLMTGSASLKAGVEYSGIFERSNSLRVNDGTRISVNRRPFVKTLRDEILLLHQNFTYSVEADTVISLFRLVTNNLDILFEKACVLDHALVKNTESASVCSYDLPEQVDANKGQFGGVFYVTNNSNNTTDATINFKRNGTIEATHTTAVGKATTKAISASGDITTAWSAGDTLTLTAEVTNDDCHIYASINNTLIRVEKQL